ncbi:plant dual-specificity MAP kinase kinase family domain protein (macronuclear) [Tetrahymena thermophila SB210]|uniref:non-specific serine/threonine protein kinase n=1 Tax=Tetrahymena thermophila (strain SB210) TaxID=312017 RepID=Q24DN1_TETTS|nr:plant dual-specificity MAP kinase kinase family domain protein [Tetrahymena thermophila SB210]EAS05882.2 plant dual-specificity MAP kinase kinase family domain protein [Tetrahymena thermophila SB210]|eukprot:XP_001026127.2 plant dual-specificity MAP kinase kinase family domain protein [Tetrahymena thermophila SB210]
MPKFLRYQIRSTHQKKIAHTKNSIYYLISLKIAVTIRKQQIKLIIKEIAILQSQQLNKLLGKSKFVLTFLKSLHIFVQQIQYILMISQQLKNQLIIFLEQAELKIKMTDILKNKVQNESSNSDQNANSVSCLSDFEILKKLGQGAHGVVYKVRRKKDQNTYVLKQILAGGMQQKQRKECINEAILLNKLNSPYIVRYYDSFLENNQLCIVMEYCEQGDLENFIKNQMGRPLVEKKIWKFFFQIAEGLLELHTRNILHRDIKTMNLFLTGNEQIRIGDLGVAKQLENNKSHAHSQVGTPYYMSPEIIQDIPYNEKSDVWSLGCVLYQLATFKRPFEATNQGSLVLKIQKAQYIPISSNYSPQLHRLIELCLTKEHQKRYSIKQLLTDPEIEMKAKQIGHSLKAVQQLIAQNYQDETKIEQESPAKIIKSKDFILFQTKKNDNSLSQDSTPKSQIAKDQQNGSPLERSKFRNFKLQIIANQSSGNNSEKETPLQSQSDLHFINQEKSASKVELQKLIKSPQVVSRTKKLIEYGINKSINSTPSERLIQEQRESLGNNVFKQSIENFRSYSPQIKFDQLKCDSPIPFNQPNHMRSTKSQLGFQQIGVGNSANLNSMAKQPIRIRKETDLNFSKVVQQQQLLNQQHLQKSISCQNTFKTVDYEDRASEQKAFPQIKQQQALKKMSIQSKQEQMRRYDSCDKNINQDRLVNKYNINDQNTFSSNNFNKMLSTQFNLTQNSTNNITNQVVSQKLSSLQVYPKQSKTNAALTSMNRLVSDMSQHAKSYNTKKSMTHLSQTDLDKAFNQMQDEEETEIEVPKNTDNPQLSKYYKQKFELSVQSQQLQKVCTNILGQELYQKVLGKFKHHINREVDISKQDQDKINLIIDTDLKYKQECVNKLYQIISIENQIQDLNQKINQIEINS